jgi:cytochrome P450
VKEIVMSDVLPTYPMARVSPWDPPPGLAAIQDGERVVRVRLWDGSAPWLVTGYEEVRAILADPRASADTDREGYPHVSAGTAARKHAAKTFINMDNPRHDQIRRLLTPFFTVKRIEAMRPRIAQIVGELIDQMLAGPAPADFVEVLALPIPSMVICELLGVPYSERERFNALSKTMISRLTTPEQSVAAQQQILDFMGRLIDEKDASPGDDMISRLVVDHLRAGDLTRQELIVLGRLLLVAGHETTSNMIALGTMALLLRPALLAEVRDSPDPALVANAVDELLRWLTILHVGRRRVALDDIELAGKHIARGEGIIVSLDMANRDAAAFPDPGTLDIHRRARHHVAFSYGIHQCLGQPLARVELQVIYPMLFRRIPTLALAADPATLRFKHDNVVYGVHELPVTW